MFMALIRFKTPPIISFGSSSIMEGLMDGWTTTLFMVVDKYDLADDMNNQRRMARGSRGHWSQPVGHERS